jgi:hypothetical protein
LLHFTLHVALHPATSLHTVPALASCLPDIFLWITIPPFELVLSAPAITFRPCADENPHRIKTS